MPASYLNIGAFQKEKGWEKDGKRDGTRRTEKTFREDIEEKKEKKTR